VAGAIAIYSVEAIENVRLLFGCNANACILDLNQSSIVIAL
jgi:hypothetical protein